MYEAWKYTLNYRINPIAQILWYKFPLQQIGDINLCTQI